MTKVDDLEARISNLQSRMSGVDGSISYVSSRGQTADSKIDNLSQRLSVLEERVSHLPTKEFIVKAAVGVITIFGLLAGFQNKIDDLFHARQSEVRQPSTGQTKIP